MDLCCIKHRKSNVNIVLGITHQIYLGPIKYEDERWLIFLMLGASSELQLAVMVTTIIPYS
jgi:hypothetical protein